MRPPVRAIAVVLVACGGTTDDRVRGDEEGTPGSGSPASTSHATSGATGSAAPDGATAATGPGSGAGEGGAGGAGDGGGAGGIPMLVGGGGAAADPEIVRLCAQHVFACGNALDDDDDGLVDAADPDCHGACDDGEATLWNEVGAPGPPCAVDCYFDDDAGAANDGCRWDLRCDRGSVAPTFDPTGEELCAHDPDVVVPGGAGCDGLRAAQSAACLASCLPLVPNGCDCFGCCARPAGSGTFWMGSHDDAWMELCSTTTLDDPTVCRPCEQVPSCLNPCEACEVCLGGQVPAPGCDPAAQCPPGVAACGLPGQPLCPDLTYCVSGCCRDVAR